MLRAVQTAMAAVFGLSIASLISFAVEDGTKPSGDAVVWVLIGVAICAALVWVVVTAFQHRQKPAEVAVPAASVQGYGEPQNREDLRRWLDVRIEEIVAWRATLDEQAAQPVPDINVTGSIENMFWSGLNNEVHRKLHLLAPEWTEYWGESPDWFFAEQARSTSDQVAEFSRFLGWSAERLRHIKRELP